MHSNLHKPLTAPRKSSALKWKGGRRRNVVQLLASIPLAVGLASSAFAQVNAAKWRDVNPQLSSAAQGCTPPPLNSPSGIAVDLHGIVYVGNRAGTSVISKISREGAISMFYARALGDHRLYGDISIAVDPHENVYWATRNIPRIEKVDAKGSLVLSIGHSSHTGSHSTEVANAFLHAPVALAVDNDGQLFFIDSRTVKKFDPRRGVSIVGGHSNSRPHYQDGSRNTASLHSPNWLVVARDGSLLISDGGGIEEDGRAWQFASVRKMDRTGSISTLAGGFYSAYGSDIDGTHYTAMLMGSRAIGLLSNGSIVVAEDDPPAVRAIDSEGGMASLLKQSPHSKGLRTVTGLTVAPDGSLYLLDSLGGQLYRISPEKKIQTLCIN